MNIREYIKNPKRFIYLLGIKGFLKFLSDENFVRLMYRCKFNEKLNLDSPRSFDEKIQWLKLNEHNELYTKLVDKYEVKEYIKEIIGEEYVVPTLGLWEKFDDIDFNTLPNQFVLKATHDSGGIAICSDKSSFDINEARKIINHSLKRNYYDVGREWPYKYVKPRILAEPLLVDESGDELKDYKVFNFNGIPKVIQVDYDRFRNHRRNIYDTEWNYIPAEILYPTDSNVNIPKPVCLDKLLDLAKILSQPFIHVRTDFYIINGKILFGELTFLHGSGFEEFRPKSFGIEMGNWMELSTKK